MIKAVLKDRWMTAEEIFHDSRLNKMLGASVRTIKRLLDDEGLNAYRPRVIHNISEENKEKRLKFC